MRGESVDQKSQTAGSKRKGQKRVTKHQLGENCNKESESSDLDENMVIPTDWGRTLVTEACIGRLSS